MNSLTKILSDIRRQANKESLKVKDPLSWEAGRHDGLELAAEFIEIEFKELLEKIRDAESEIIEKEITS